MTDTRIASMGQAIANGEDHILFSERQSVPDIADALKISGAIVVTVLVLVSLLGGAGVALSFIVVIGGILAGAIWLRATDARRMVCLVAYPGYFLAIRSEKWKKLSAGEWDLSSTPGSIIAVIDRAGDLRPEERQSLTGGPNPEKDMRDIVLFQEGRMMILLAARMGEDQSIEKLHKVRAFFAKHAAGKRSAQPTLSTPSAQAAPSAPSRKGTLS